MTSLTANLALAAVFCAQMHGAQPPLSVDISKINDPVQPDLPIGAKGSPVVRAQILLARAHFSCSEIDANFGTNLDKTVRAFQGDRNLPVTGVVDPATWAALNADTAPPITTYTITPEDVQGPFAAVLSDMKAQAKLPALGYTSAVEAVSERF